MKPQKMPKQKDKKIFRNIAQTTKTVNITRKHSRGGIRK